MNAPQRQMEVEPEVPEPRRVYVRPKEKEKETPMGEYIQYFERVMNANKWNGEEAGEIFMAMLGPGERALDSLNGQWETFQDLKKLILEKEKPLRDANLTELMRLTLKEAETIESLHNRSVSLVGKCYPTFSQEVQSQLARDHFLHALPEQMRLQVIAAKPDTLEDTVSLAKSSMLLGSMEVVEAAGRGVRNRAVKKFWTNSDNARRKFYTNDDKVRGIRCYCCQGLGHYQSECPSRRKAANVSEDAEVVRSNPGEDLLLRHTEQSQ